MEFPLHLIPLIPIVAAAVNLIIGRRLPRDGVAMLAVGSVATSCILAAMAFLRMTGLYGEDAAGILREKWYVWFAAGGLSADASFLFDSLSGVMALIVTFVGLLIHIYSIGYMSHERDYARYFGYLNLFTGSMLVLVLG